MAVMAEYFDRSHENNRKRRKFTTCWDIPPPESQGCVETSSKRSRKSSWDVPPLFFQELVSGQVEHSDLMDLLYGLLEYDPVKRLTAAEALKHPFFRRSRR